MAQYGVTENGFVLKRLDNILEDVHGKLSGPDGLGFDTRLYSDTFLNVLITSFCGEISELWEEAQDAYYALYPSTAEGINLDNAVQFSGITRASARKTKYRIHCTGDDGTYVETSTIASNTMPQILLDASEAYTISRENFYALAIKIVSAAAGEYTVTLDGIDYTYTAASGADEATISAAILAAVSKAPGVTCTAEDNVITITQDEVYQSGTCALTNNLTTDWVTTIADYETQEDGAITIPDGVICKIITNTPGLTSVENRITPTLGRLKETDVELRQSNLAKSAIRSTTMVTSVTSYLLNNVDGVISAKGYENYTDETDSDGRPPHSVEFLVDGGEDQAVAEGILAKRTGGIRPYGSVVVPVLTANGDTLNVGFSRPEKVYAWIKVVLHGTDLPGDAAQVVSDIIEASGDGTVGENIYLQEYIGDLYKQIDGIRYVEITAGTTASDSADTPEYTLQNIIVTYRQKVMISGDRIEVSIDDT